MSDRARRGAASSALFCDLRRLTRRYTRTPGDDRMKIDMWKNESLWITDFRVYEKNPNPNPGVPHE
jgi:hypothetical protein